MIFQSIVKCFCYVLGCCSLFALIAFMAYLLFREKKWRPRKVFRKVFGKVACSWACLLALSICALCSSLEYSTFISSCAGFIVAEFVLAGMLPGMVPFVISVFLASILTVVVRLLCPRYAEIGDYSWVFTIMVLVITAIAVHSGQGSRSKEVVSPKNVLPQSRDEMVHSLLIILMTAALMTLSSSVEPGDSLLGNFLSSLCFLAQTAIFLLRSVELLSEDASPLMDVCPDVSGGIVNLCVEPQNQEDNEDSSSVEIFERLVRYFEEEKPYLNPDLNITDVAKGIFSNKVYISRAVNICTGRNFCQFVNYYRIRYALNLFISDPAMKITQIARMSGFNTFPTFNLAFRLYMNEAPRDWCRRYIQEHELSVDEK